MAQPRIELDTTKLLDMIKGEVEEGRPFLTHQMCVDVVDEVAVDSHLFSSDMISQVGNDILDLYEYDKRDKKQNVLKKEGNSPPPRPAPPPKPSSEANHTKPTAPPPPPAIKREEPSAAAPPPPRPPPRPAPPPPRVSAILAAFGDDCCICSLHPPQVTNDHMMGQRALGLLHLNRSHSK